MDEDDNFWKVVEDRRRLILENHEQAKANDRQRKMQDLKS